MNMRKFLANKKSHLIAFFLLAMGIIFTIVGFQRGEAMLVLSKATKVCLECIGIG